MAKEKKTKEKKTQENKKGKKTSKQKKSKKGLFNKGLFKITALAVIFGCIVMVITIENDCAEQEKEMASIQAQIDAYNMQNAELERTLESDDLSAYMERIALEDRGYAYPDERRFYDTSRD